MADMADLIRARAIQRLTTANLVGGRIYDTLVDPPANRITPFINVFTDNEKVTGRTGNGPVVLGMMVPLVVQVVLEANATHATTMGTLRQDIRKALGYTLGNLDLLERCEYMGSDDDYDRDHKTVVMVRTMIFGCHWQEQELGTADEDDLDDLNTIHHDFDFAPSDGSVDLSATVTGLAE